LSLTAPCLCLLCRHRERENAGHNRRTVMRPQDVSIGGASISALSAKHTQLHSKVAVAGLTATRSLIVRLKCDGTRTETRFRLSAKRTSPFKSAGASVQATTGSRGVRISGSNAGYTMFRGSVKSTGYPLHSPVSPSLPLPCVTVCHHLSTGLYRLRAVPLPPRTSARSPDTFFVVSLIASR
jgi:hypothetical protein